MSVNLSPIGNGINFLTTTGLPLAAGQIFTYQAGSTTPLTTYTDSSGLYANTNPIILGVDGRVPSEIWLTSGYNYKFVVEDASNNVIATYDNLYGIPSSTSGGGSSIPSGCIIIWSGAAGAIPSGYYLCNGSNGTPDLRNSFVLGAGNTYSVGQTGGSTDAVLVSHNHTINDAGHFHVENVSTTNSGGSGYGVNNDAGSFSGSQASNVNTSTATTGITINTVGSSASGANMPPYYALCYIMKA